MPWPMVLHYSLMKSINSVIFIRRNVGPLRRILRVAVRRPHFTSGKLKFAESSEFFTRQRSTNGAAVFFCLFLFLFFFFTFAFVVPQDPVECQSRCYFCTRHNGGWRLCSFHFRANGRNGADETINAKFANRWNCRSTTSPFCRSRSSRFFFSFRPSLRWDSRYVFFWL